MRQLAVSAAIAIILCTIVCANAEVSIYVSSAGDDRNPGTLDHPIQTLAHARDLVREKNNNSAGDITVYLDPGVYRLTKPLQLTQEDSGVDGHDVIYTAAPGKLAIISGALQITGWKLVDASRNLWSAQVPDDLKNTRQLYVDGVRALRTCGRLPVKLNETRTGYTADSPAMADWRNPSDIEFVYTGGNALWSEPSEGLGAWTEPRCPVASIHGTEITMAQPCWNNSTRRVMLPESSGFNRTANLVGPAHFGRQPYYVENAYELLGKPGQWYLDRPAKTIYYVPRPGEDLPTADVEAPLIEKLIDAQGTADHPLQNIVFSNLQFSYATWLFPCTGEGFSEIQANYMVTGPDGYATQGLGKLAPHGREPFGAWTKTPGNVSLVFDRHVRFLHDVFTHLGAAGLELGTGSQVDQVEGCIFTDISANALELGGVDLPEAAEAQATGDDRIDNNHFYNIAAEYHGGVAIDAGYVQRTDIEHNQIDHVPYSGISIGWGGWPDKIHQPGVANNSQNNRIADNLIFNHMFLLADGGGIYTQGLTGPSLAQGEKVQGNVVRDQFSTGHAIYSDNGSANMTITGNVMFHTNFDNWGSAHANYYDGNDGKTRDPFDIENNSWQQGNPDSVRENVTMKGNRIISELSQAPQETLSDAGLTEPFRDLLTAQLVKSVPPAPPQRVSVAGGDGWAYVSWCPPTFQGSSPVSSYTVRSSNGDTAQISSDDFWKSGYVKVTGLSNDTDYRFTVSASNSTGAGEESMPSNPVRPGAKSAAPPGEPRVGDVYAQAGKVSVHFQAPEQNSGAPITAFLLTAQPGGKQVRLTGRGIITLDARHSTFGVIDGLESGTTYTIEVQAVNEAGSGPPAKSKPVTP